VLAEHKIAATDLTLFRVCDDADEAVDHIRSVLARRAARSPAPGST